MSAIVNLLLRPLGMSWQQEIERFLIKGTVDQVRKRVGGARLMPIRAVEITGPSPAGDRSCAFLAELTDLEYLRLHAAELSDIEAIQALPRLTQLSITRVAKRQSIAVDLAALTTLARLDTEWFVGAVSLFGSVSISDLCLTKDPQPTSDALARLSRLCSLRLAAGGLREVRAVGQLRELTWLALLNMRRLEDFGGLRGHPSLSYVWLEGCPKLNTLEILADMSSLETLRILDCGDLTGVEALGRLPHLRHLHIHGLTRAVAHDWAFLRAMPKLESVVVKGMAKAESEYWQARNRGYDLLRGDLRGRKRGP